MAALLQDFDNVLLAEFGLALLDLLFDILAQLGHNVFGLRARQRPLTACK